MRRRHLERSGRYKGRRAERTLSATVCVLEFAETVFRNTNKENPWKSSESVASTNNQSPDKSTVVDGPDESYYAAEDEQEITNAVEEEE